MNNPIRNANRLFLLVLLGFFIRYGFNIFLSRHLTAEMYGDFNLALKVLAVLTSLSLFGTNVSAKRFLARYLHLNKHTLAGDYIAWNIRFVSLSFLIIVLIAIITLAIMMILHFFHVYDLNKYHLALYMIWIAPMAATATLLESFLLCTEHVLLPTLFSDVIRYLILLLFFYVTLHLVEQLNSFTIILVLSISYLTLALLVLFSLNPEVRSMIHSGVKKLHLKVNMQNEWFQTSSKMIGNNIISTLASVLDLFIVEIFTKEESQVGYYAAVLTVTSLINLLHSSLYQGLKPTIAELSDNEQGKKRLQQYINSLNLFVFFIMAVVGTIIVYFSHFLLVLFGPQYIKAQPALVILSIFTCLSTVGVSARLVLVYSGFEKMVKSFNTLELLAVFLLVVPATYYFNITGTATATGLVILIKPLCSLYYVRKKMGIRGLFLV